MPKKNVVTIGQYPTPDDAIVSASVKAICELRRADKVVVAHAASLSKDQLYDRLRGDTYWRASEVAAIARYFHIRIGDLYDGLGGRFAPAGPLAQLEELRTFNPKSPMVDFPKLAAVIPFPTTRSPRDLASVIAS